MNEKTSSPTSSAERPVARWPIHRRIVLLDAYMRNPIEVTIKHHWNDTHIGADDDRGVRHFAHVARIAGFAPDPVTEFDDILGPAAGQNEDDFADILG